MHCTDTWLAQLLKSERRHLNTTTRSTKSLPSIPTNDKVKTPSFDADAEHVIVPSVRRQNSAKSCKSFVRSTTANQTLTEAADNPCVKQQLLTTQLQTPPKRRGRPPSKPKPQRNTPLESGRSVVVSTAVEDQNSQPDLKPEPERSPVLRREDVASASKATGKSSQWRNGKSLAIAETTMDKCEPKSRISLIEAHEDDARNVLASNEVRKQSLI
jgi:hypothetical protein